RRVLEREAPLPGVGLRELVRVELHRQLAVARLHLLRIEVVRPRYAEHLERVAGPRRLELPARRTERTVARLPVARPAARHPHSVRADVLRRQMLPSPAVRFALAPPSARWPGRGGDRERRGRSRPPRRCFAGRVLTNTSPRAASERRLRGVRRPIARGGTASD